MKFLLVILLICKPFDAFETVYEELSPEPFEVPPLSDSIVRGSRIVFGSQAGTTQFPYFALIFIKRPAATVQCGACLIKEDWAITADHCVREALSIELRLGLTYRDTFEQKVYAAALARHAHADLALIKLSTSVKLTDAVQPLLLPRLSLLNNALVNEVATVCGMGVENQQTYATSNVLRYTQLRIMSQTECSKYYGLVDATRMCAIHQTSLSSTCPGDSGSPLVVYENNQPVLVGLVSFGAAAGCDLGFPVGYVKVTLQISWIASYTGLDLTE